MPPRKKLLVNEEKVLLARPQRNTKAKIVFDPSDTHIPKKRKKFAKQSGKFNIGIKKSGNNKKKELKSYSNPVNEVPTSSTNGITITAVYSLSDSPEKHTTPELPPETLHTCFICEKGIIKKELIDCPICLIKAHRDCLIIDEPIWKFKLEQCPWFCKTCREHYCSKCLKRFPQEEDYHSCITCDVGLHIECYESYETKPLHKLKTDMYVCIPCMTLATQIVPEVEGDEGFSESRPSSILPSMSDEDDSDAKSVKSFNSSISSQNSNSKDSEIPDVTNWDKFRICRYLSKRGLPDFVTDKIIDCDIDGHALHLLQRSDITSNMGLKLGPAMKFYKEVRILQTQSLCYSVFWK